MSRWRVIPNRAGMAGLLLGALLATLLAGPALAAKPEPAEPLQLLGPARLALDAPHSLWVSDYTGQAVLRYDLKSLQITDRFAVAGRPLGIAAGHGLLYVGNQSTASVEVYNRQGKLLRRLLEGISLPNAIVYEPSIDKLFVLDSAARRVTVIDRQGQLLGRVPADDQPPLAQLANPTALAVDPAQQQILISDQPTAGGFGTLFRRQSGAVRIYTYNGTYTGIYSGELKGPFTRPQGLRVTGNTLYLTDGVRGQVLVYDLETRALLRTHGSFGSGPDQLNLPLDVVHDATRGRLLVTDNRNGRIQVFPEGGAP